MYSGWLVAYLQNSVAIITSIFKALSCFFKQRCAHWSFFPSPLQALVCVLSADIFILDITYKQNHTTHILLCLASFSLHTASTL